MIQDTWKSFELSVSFLSREKKLMAELMKKYPFIQDDLADFPKDGIFRISSDPAYQTGDHELFEFLWLDISQTEEELTLIREATDEETVSLLIELYGEKKSQEEAGEAFGGRKPDYDDAHNKRQ